MLLNATRIRRGEAGDFILLAILDITQQEDEKRQLVALKEFAEKTVDAVRDPLLILTTDLHVKSSNQPFYDTFKVTPSETVGRFVYDLGNGQWNIPELRTLLEDVLPDNDAFDDYVVEHDFRDIGHRVMVLNGRRLDHEPLILLAIEDITERRLSERRQSMLVGELQHRVKNLLMNVRTLARQSYIGADNREEFMKLLDGRLDALARTQDLAARSPDSVVALDALIRLELSAVHMADRADIQVCDIHLPPGIAQLMAMTVHELTTNAIKYGALSVDEGRIDVDSAIEFQSGGKFMRFRWREHGVRIDTSIKRRGFGFQIIEESLPYLLGGSSKLEFHPDGIECTMSVPLPNDRS
jgi:two-component sensor histidine kinase